ncbi:MAG TPA: hypothetical protein VF800_00705 [Telluria sp.]|jgi:hypothetical protein
MHIDEAHAYVEQLIRCVRHFLVRIERSGMAGRTKMIAGFTILVMDRDKNLP